MEKHHRAELHLLPIPPPPPQPGHRRHPPKPPRPPPTHHHHQQAINDHHHVPSLDLQLSISLSPFKAPPPPKESPLRRRVEALKWQAAEQNRLAAMERAYVERVRELTRREMELAQTEMARARFLWEKAKEEVARVERMKEKAITFRPPYPQQVSSAPISNTTCMEITCRSCRRRFHPIYT